MDRREEAVTRFRQLQRVRAWSEWPAAEAKLREVGCTPEQVAEVRKGVEAVVLHGSAATTDADVAWHTSQILSVLLHQGYEILTLTRQPGEQPHWRRSRLHGNWIVTVRRDSGE